MPTQDKKIAPKAHRPALIAGVVVIIVLLAAPFGYLAAMSGRVMPGVAVNGLAVGGLTKNEAGAKLEVAVAAFETELNFTNGKRSVKIDTGRKMIALDSDAGLAAAYGVGRSGSIIDRLGQAGRALFFGARASMPYSYDAKSLKAALKSAWGNDETPVIDARVAISMSGDTLTNATVVSDRSGFEYDYDRAISDVKTKQATLDPTPVMLAPARTEASVKTADVAAVKALVPAALALAPLEMSADELKWTLAPRDLAGLLGVAIKSGAPALQIDHAAAAAYFGRLAADYDIQPTATHYEIDPTTNKMTVFEPGKDGRSINIEGSIAALQSALEKQLAGADGKTGFNLVYTPAKSQVVSQSAADLGINEVIGVGVSDFSGSSGNRIKNVSHGSSKLNGILIAPDAEFSAIDALNPVTIEDGYFPEQIILGDKIEPAVGGGLCQIGTTLFRMAMNAGLPITERQNHSLVVHYYSDPVNNNPGTDATLYGPHPDLRFINNTGHWLLITTAIDVKNHKLTYTLWGTADGRKGSYTHPTVTNWIAAPTEVQNLNDPTLPVGAQKCQNAFRGANATFVYTIANADGTVTTKNFNSHYRALPKICAYGTGIPGTKLPDGTVVPPAPKTPIANPLALPAAPAANVNEPMNNINIPPEAAVGN
jgi:vancomycin resistance protein YoaR